MPEAVLIVEDEQAVREVLATWLENAGYQTMVATNGLEGLKEMYDHQPDLIIADVVMPQIDGFEMCRLIREISATPIMFLTCLGEESSRKQGLSLGADDYLAKPVQRGHLLSRVDHLLHRFGSPRTVSTIETLRPHLASRPQAE